MPLAIISLRGTQGALSQLLVFKTTTSAMRTFRCERAHLTSLLANFTQIGFSPMPVCALRMVKMLVRIVEACRSMSRFALMLKF